MSTLPKLVIVDDDISICETLKIALSVFFDVKFFLNTKDTLEYFKSNPDPVLLILDYKIKNNSGVDFYKKEIKGKGRNIPTILISGFIGQNTFEECQPEINSLFVKVLEKPFDIFELISFIRDNVLKNN